ncbi:MAG: DNA photolyase family protein [Verrucomicrobiae bacterium]|nr:DNA photolyase family protein [Verrucomicrobiae bacterium]
MEEKPAIVWFRQDLRMQDNAALKAALESGRPVIPLYIMDDEGEGDWPMGGASRWWLHHALKDLGEHIREAGGRLVIRVGNSLEQLRSILRECEAQAVYWNRRYEPAIIERDKAIKQELTEGGLEVKSFNSSLLHEPHAVTKKDGTPYKVFTPYWKYCLTLKKDEPQIVNPRSGAFWSEKLESESLDSLGLLPSIPWDEAFYDHWEPTVKGADKALKDFVRSKLGTYKNQRNFPGIEGTSRLSPYLHFGQIGPRQIWKAVKDAEEKGEKSTYRFLAEIGWREFSYHLLYHFSHTPEQPLRPEFEDFPWERDSQLVEAWQKGQTGYPIVDAGMRELWKTGWMHNRVRMIAASFLVKHLLQPWQEGALWFWDTLVDADLANNTLGWQWTAGCGADAAPYFRVFNPVLQGRKFDPEGAYVRQWLPEIAALPTALIHEPWTATDLDWRAAGLQRGQSYPDPIVGLTEGRDRALSAYQELKNLTSS